MKFEVDFENDVEVWSWWSMTIMCEGEIKVDLWSKSLKLRIDIETWGAEDKQNARSCKFKDYSHETWGSALTLKHTVKD